MRRLIPVGILGTLLLFAVGVAGEEEGQAPPAEKLQGPKLTYDQAAKDPNKIRNRRVTWDGYVRGMSGKDLMVALNPDAPEHLLKWYVVRCATQADADALWDSREKQITGTFAGTTNLTHSVPDQNGGFVTVEAKVPLLIQPKVKK